MNDPNLGMPYMGKLTPNQSTVLTIMIYVIFLFKKTYFGWSLLKNDPCNIPAGNAIKQYN